MNGGLDRRGSAPRSVLVLLAAAVLALGALWLARGRSQDDFTLGGSLFPVAADSIDGLLLTREGLQYRFDRQPEGIWSLSGSSADYLDPSAMASLVNDLPTVLGGAVLPGTETEDRRYDFNGPEAIRLRVFRSDGEDLSVSLGTSNPVTDTYYASGAGREGCFPVSAGFRQRLVQLPSSVQARTLLPAFDRDLVQEVRLQRGQTEHRFRVRNGKWWLLLGPDPDGRATAFLPPLVRQYQALYGDRRLDDADGRWLMASDQALGQLIHEVSRTIVREILEPREAAARLKQWELDPPWRQVVLLGPGLNPDPGAPVPDQFTIGFGTPIAEDRVPALRRGNVLLTDRLALTLVDQSLDALIEQLALNEVARQADRLQLEREGKVLLKAGRTGTAEEGGDGRTAWLTTVPAAGEGSWVEQDRHGLGRDLVVNLNRLEVLAVLPPTTDAGVLADRERVRIRLTWEGSADGQGGPARELVLESGFVVPAHLPAGAGPLANTPDGGPAAALWFPATGKLLQISNTLVVTARSIAGP